MGVIRVLDSAVADQIAAGEVVERPSSVVKELVENALDAGASRVDVDVVEGGLARIVVTDDGCGMDADDAVLCFSRHATSKLVAAEDLRRIGTFGFRGEALAAIASVARVRLLTRRAHHPQGFAVDVEGGRVLKVGEAGGPPGTRVDVADLFWNVPARRKFLKSPRTEAGHVQDMLLSMALARPGVAVRLTIDGKVTLDLPPVPPDAPLDHPARVDRVVRCLGKHVRPLLFPVQGQTEVLTLSGYVVAPLETRRDLQGIHLSVNGRPVADRVLVQAVRAAFRTLLEVGRQPIVALDVALDKESVDVNVHPRKAEVRFADPRGVSGHLISLLSEFLVTTPWLQRPTSTSAPVFRLHDAERPHAAEPAPADDVVAAARERVKEALARYHSNIDAAPGSPQKVIASKTIETTQRPPSSSPPLTSTPGRAGAPLFQALRVVGQVGGTYLVLDGPDGMVVIDQHAAHERVVFERLRAARRRIRADGSPEPAPSQPLLLPLTVELTATERAVLDDDEVRAELSRHGLDVEGWSHQTALVRSVPAGLDGRKAASILRDALGELASVGRTGTFDDRVDAVCARWACHAAVRAGDVLGPAQIRALLQDLDRIDLGAHCPHGRPVVRTVTFAELSRWFDR